MKALILVGGYGTRLRPLTLSVPKPLIHFCNISIVEHQIAALIKVGVRHVILAVAYQPAAMMEALQRLENKFGVRISCSRETEPLGTAGPIRLARDLLLDGDDPPDDPFFVFNSDVICEFPLDAMLRYHQGHGGDGTILVTKVDEPSKFGVVVSDESTGQIRRFVEKPIEFVGREINAGLYIFNKSVIDRIQLRPMSIEKEIFPAMAFDRVLYRFPLTSFWADIGEPKDFLTGQSLFLQSLTTSTERDGSFRLASGDHIIGNVLIHPSAIIGRDCLIGPDVTVGQDCTIGDGVRLKNSSVMEGVKISSNCYVDGSIVGWQSKLGRWVRLEGLTVVGEDVVICDHCFINQATILPHKHISESVFQPGRIIM